MKYLAIAAAASSLLAAPAIAEAVYAGEGSLTSGYTTGNTETTDLGLGLKLSREADIWRQSGELSADYGKTDGEETRNRTFAAGQVDRKFENPRWSSYVRGSYEQDQFSGFDSRAFLGAGIGFLAVDQENTKWSLEGGPGYRIDELDPVYDANDVLLTDSTTEESAAFRAGSRFTHAFNESVHFSNDTDVIYTELTTQLVNTAAITAQLMGNLSARLSYDVRHDTEAPADREATDTATRFSLVYGFGD